MGWLKKGALKSVTKKRAKMLHDEVSKIIKDNPHMEIKDALLQINPLGELDKDLSWDQLFVIMVASEVTAELSYDPTMGNKGDYEIIHDTVYKLLKKWAY